MRRTYCDLVLDASRHNDVCDISLGFYEFVEVRFDEGEPLFYAAFDVSAAVGDISEDLRSALVSELKYKEQIDRISYVVLKGKGLLRLRQKSSDPTCRVPFDHVEQRFLPK